MSLADTIAKTKSALGSNFLPKGKSKLKEQQELITNNVKTAIGISTQKKDSKRKELGIGLPQYKLHISSQVLDHDRSPVSITAYLPDSISMDFSSDYDEPFNQSILGDNLFGNTVRAFGNSGLVQEMTYKVWKSSRGITFNLPLVFVADDEYNNQGNEYSDIMAPILKLHRLCAPSKSSTSVFLNPPGSRLAFREGFQTTGKDFLDSLNQSMTSNGIEVNAEGTKFGAIGSGVAADINDGNFVEGAIHAAKGAYQAGATAFNSLKAVTVALNGAIKNQLELVNKTSVSIGSFLYLDSVEFESVSSQYDVILDAKGKPLRATVNVTFSTSMTPTIEDIYKIFRYSKNNVKTAAKTR